MRKFKRGEYEVGYPVAGACFNPEHPLDCYGCSAPRSDLSPLSSPPPDRLPAICGEACNNEPSPFCFACPLPVSPPPEAPEIAPEPDPREGREEAIPSPEELRAALNIIRVVVGAMIRILEDHPEEFIEELPINTFGRTNY
jgi:hypothetical protein